MKEKYCKNFHKILQIKENKVQLKYSKLGKNKSSYNVSLKISLSEGFWCEHLSSSVFLITKFAQGENSPW